MPVDSSWILCSQALLDTLTADVEFLARLNIMDYSLLLGVHDLDRAVEDAQQAIEEETDDDDYDSGGSAGIALTPPDSPGCMRQVKKIQEQKGQPLLFPRIKAAEAINSYSGRRTTSD